MLSHLLRAALGLVVGHAALCAQPSEMTIKKDLTGPNTIAVTLTSNGSKRWETDKYVWIRDAVCTLKVDIPEIPDAKLLVWGTAVYDIIGGKFSFVKFRVGENRYLGIPNPNKSDVEAFVAREGTEKLVGNYNYNKILSEKVNFEIAQDPKWEWHTPKSVSFNIVATYDILSTTSKAIETVEQPYRVRLYADQVKGPWNSLLSSAIENEKKIIGSKTITSDEWNRLEKTATLAIKESERLASASLSKLPKMTLPEFTDDKHVILHTHKVLRESSKEEVHAYLMAMLAPHFFQEGSTTRLTQRGADLINQTLERAFGAKITYKELYCEDPPLKHYQANMMEYYAKVGQRYSRISVIKTGGTYKEGVKVGEQWKINDMSISGTTNDDEIAYVRSFNDPKKLCPEAVKVEKLVWKTHSLAPARASIAFPGDPAASEVPMKEGRKCYIYDLTAGGGQFIFRAYELGKKVDLAQSTAMIDNMAKSFATKNTASMGSSRLYKYGASKGKDVDMQTGDTKIRYVAVVVGDMMYEMVILSKNITSDMAQGFFNSFKVQ
jgi:hypothetical protein